MKKKKDMYIFYNSIFYVLGFSLVFSLLGVLLQGVLSSVSEDLSIWLGRIGGVLIVLFGLYLVGLIKIKFFEREHKITIKKEFNSSYITSFIFGATFAVGWSPCVGPLLGAVLTLAALNPASGFFMLLAFSLGLGIPFLIVGFFTEKAKIFIKKTSKWVCYLRIIFGVLLIAMGIFVFTGNLGMFSSFNIPSEILIMMDVNYDTTNLNLWVAFVAGVVTFLSPCVLPLIPAFLTYLGSLAVKK